MVAKGLLQFLVSRIYASMSEDKHRAYCILQNLRCHWLEGTLLLLYITAKETTLPIRLWKTVFRQMHPELSNWWNAMYNIFSYVRMSLKPFTIPFPLCQQTSHTPVLKPVPGSIPVSCICPPILFSPGPLEVCSFCCSTLGQFCASPHHFTKSLASPTTSALR